ncbi:unnamed protein product, partial [Effrenium voratum]
VLARLENAGPPLPHGDISEVAGGHCFSEELPQYSSGEGEDKITFATSLRRKGSEKRIVVHQRCHSAEMGFGRGFPGRDLPLASLYRHCSNGSFGLGDRRAHTHSGVTEENWEDLLPHILPGAPACG